MSIVTIDNAPNKASPVNTDKMPIGDGSGNPKHITLAQIITAAKLSIVDDIITDGVVDVAASENAIHDALALKEDAASVAADSRAACVAQTITNGVTTSAPSQDAVYDALALKEDASASTTALALKVDKTTTVNGHALSGNINVTASDLTLGNVANIALTGSINLAVDGGGSAISTGALKGSVTCTFAGTITNYYLSADQSGSIVIDVKRSGSSIVGAGNKPTLSTAQTSSAAVASWTSAVVAIGDVLTFNVDSITSITNVTLILKVTRTS